jgi:YgiT-type zinc finger domain-containing protein
MAAESASAPQQAPCPRCGAALTATSVRTTIWQGDRVAIVEDIPAHVCAACLEQFYDDDVSDALRRLAEQGFPAQAAVRHLTVPVFSLTGRVRPRAPMPDDTLVD